MINRPSLKVRYGLILVFLLLVLMPAMFFSIGQAYYASLVEGSEDTLEAHLYSLVAKVKIKQGKLLPITLISPELMRKNSDTFAYIYLDKKIAWQSDSASHYSYKPEHHASTPGKVTFDLTENSHHSFRQLNFIFFMDVDNIEYQVTVFLLTDEATIADQMSEFRKILRYWLIIIALVMSFIMIAGFVWSSHPLKRLDREIISVENGEANQILGHYPIELKKIQQDLNLLLNTQQRQKETYRTSLSNLAHALKTPLAVLTSSELGKHSEHQEQLARINNIIEHQLKKAAFGGTDTWKKYTEVNPVAESIIRAMGKVYSDKKVKLLQKMDHNSLFLGDKADLMELMGNILDNAFKACLQIVELKVHQKNNQLTIIVGDDGPGIPLEKQSQLTIRGQRLDTYEKGHGVGMAIVSDLVDSYKGDMTISQSPLGGAQFTLIFNSD
jgi:two-component system sensor histidine kinase PhoQ